MARLLQLLALCVFVAGCGGESEEPTPEQPAPANDMDDKAGEQTAETTAPDPLPEETSEELADRYFNLFEELEAEQAAEEAERALSREQRREERSRAKEARQRDAEEARQRALEDSRLQAAEAEKEAAEEASRMSAREADLLDDPVVQELRAKIEGAKQGADDSMSVVRAWISSEIDTLFAYGAADPTIELANAVQNMQELSAELDPSGENARLMKYLWVLANRNRWQVVWSNLCGDLERGLLQTEIRQVPLHPYAVLQELPPRPRTTTNFNNPNAGSSDRGYCADRPTPVLAALNKLETRIKGMTDLATCMQGDKELCDIIGLVSNWRTGEVNMALVADQASLFGGIDYLSAERVESAKQAKEAIDAVWIQWAAANVAASELEGRIKALEVFRR